MQQNKRIERFFFYATIMIIGDSVDYRDVYERIETPLYTLEGMQRCVDDCLEKGYKDKIGINKEHRNMILHNYRKPTYTRPIILSDVKKTICELVRHTARSLYYEFLEKAKNENVNLIDVAPGFVEKNPELKYYKISYLRTIANLDDKKIFKYRYYSRSNTCNSGCWWVSAIKTTKERYYRK